MERRFVSSVFIQFCRRTAAFWRLVHAKKTVREGPCRPSEEDRAAGAAWFAGIDSWISVDRNT